MEISVINWWRKNHQSSAHEVLRLFGFCVVPWEDFRKPSIERCMGTKIGLVQNISGTQRLAQRANRIRVEHFPRIQYVAAQSRSQELIVEISWDTREFHRKDYIHVDVQRRLLWIKRMKKNASQMLNSFLYMQRDLELDNGHFLVLDQKRSHILLMIANHKENGTESQNWWW